MTNKRRKEHNKFEKINYTMARFIRSVDHEYKFPGTVTLRDVLYALIEIRESNRDKSILSRTENKAEKKIAYRRVYKFPDFLRLLFKIQNLDMLETIDFSDATDEQNPTVRTSSSPVSELPSMSLKTSTVFTVEGGKVTVRTTVTVTLPFLLPDILHPGLRESTKNKTLDVRKEELDVILNSSFSENVVPVVDGTVHAAQIAYGAANGGAAAAMGGH